MFRFFLKQGKLELLDGLDLLPLANGGFERFHFNAKHAERPIYIAPSEEMQALLPGLKDDFLESDIEQDILQLLIKASQRGNCIRLIKASQRGKGMLRSSSRHPSVVRVSLAPHQSIPAW